MVLRHVMDFLGVALDTFITILTVLGCLVSKQALAIRAFFYAVQAAFVLLGHGHSKTANCLQNVFNIKLSSVGLTQYPGRIANRKVIYKSDYRE